MFRAAFTSRSCEQPQAEQTQCLTPSCAIPLGPPTAPQSEHSWEVIRSSASVYITPPFWALYESMCRKLVQPASSTDFAIRVLASLDGLTLPTTMCPNSRTRSEEHT